MSEKTCINRITEKNFLSQCILLVFTFLFILIGSSYSQNIDKPDFEFRLDTARERDSIIFIGDTQHKGLLEFWREKNDGIAEQIFGKIATERPRFVVHLGDLTFWGSSKKQWEHFEDDAYQLIKNNIPIFPVLGNHEYIGSNKDALKKYFDHFPALEGKRWYSIKMGSAGIILLNSNFDDLSKKDLNEQLFWFNEILKLFDNDDEIKIIIAVCHHPPFTNSKVSGDHPEVEENFVNPFLKYAKARLFISGHAHNYEHFIKNGRHFIVSGGGGGPRHPVETDSKSKRHNDQFKGNEIRDFHFCKLVFNKDNIELKVVMFNPNENIWKTADSIIL